MWNKVIDFIYSKRFYICIILILICVVFKLSGSSIGLWNNYMDLDTNDGVLLGISRTIRSDEWATFTPMMFSQKFNDFKYYTNLIRADYTDVFMIYGLPVMNFLQIFRPFQLGFLFLGNSYGLSFFWCARLIALFIVTFEFLMLLTKKNKYLSFVGAIMVTLSPVIQWWFAINGIVEIFFFGQLALILLYKYINCPNIKQRIIYLFLIIFCAVGYLLVLYPSWQIPMFYVFLSLAVWIILDNKANFKFDKKDLYSIIMALIIFLIILFYIYYKSGNTIKIIMNTSYPGKRVESGGNSISSYFKMLINIFLPYKDFSYTNTNNCEMAVMFSLFPLGLVLSIINLFKDKDKALICMLVSYIFLSIWCIFGFPSFLAKITLLSKSQAARSYLAVGFLDILILFRALSINKINLNYKKAFLLSLVLSIFITLLNIHYNMFFINDLTMKIKCIVITIMFVVSFCLFFFCLEIERKKFKVLFFIAISFIMLVSGGTVNPIRYSTDNIYNSKLLKDIQNINNNEKGIWISEGMDYPKTNFILMAGVADMNSTNVYPNLERLSLLDKNNEYTHIYNRYAHIKINIVNDENIDKFELLNPDFICINMNLDDLSILNVKYIFTENNLENIDSDHFIKIYEHKQYYVYKYI